MSDVLEFFGLVLVCCLFAAYILWHFYIHLKLQEFEENLHEFVKRLEAYRRLCVGYENKLDRLQSAIVEMRINGKSGGSGKDL